MDRFFVLSGCSGGGKSTLLKALHRRAYAVVEEPGRRIIDQERAAGGKALPWRDLTAFVRRTVAMSQSDLNDAARFRGTVFFDRGLLDAASALQHITGEAPPVSIRELYNARVFLVPPWPEIYVNDSERLHGFEDAVAEYERLATNLPDWGYDPIVLPKVDVEQRADFVLANL